MNSCVPGGVSFCEKAPPIATVNHNTVNVCLQGFVIKNDRPLSMIEFSIATSYERAVSSWSLPANVVRRKGSGGV